MALLAHYCATVRTTKMLPSKIELTVRPTLKLKLIIPTIHQATAYVWFDPKEKLHPSSCQVELNILTEKFAFLINRVWSYNLKKHD